jgi:uncharacterized protein (UPF0262 family)
MPVGIIRSGWNSMASPSLIAVEIDEASIGVGLPLQASERGAAVADLLDHAQITLPGKPGPYRLHLQRDGGKLVFDLRDSDRNPLIMHVLSISPLRRVVRDYFLICESHMSALRSGLMERVETIDMARRGVHNEAAELLKERLSSKIEMDFESARLIFTLVASLCWTGREGQ